MWVSCKPSICGRMTGLTGRISPWMRVVEEIRPRYGCQWVTGDRMEAGYLEVRLGAQAWKRRETTDTQAIRQAKRAKKPPGKLVLARLILNFL